MDTAAKGRWRERSSSVSTIFLWVENSRDGAGWDGRTLSHETKFSGENGDREKKSCLTDHGQRWQP